MDGDSSWVGLLGSASRTTAQHSLGFFFVQNDWLELEAPTNGGKKYVHGSGEFLAALPQEQNTLQCFFKIKEDTLPETNSGHLKMDDWKTSFLLGRPIFRGYVSFREGKEAILNTTS